ncbi:hypothetical protein, partial [Fournierella sp.]|uniref:hypothetical protein n=1 Tax=Allofournierella sp. TaxID=1940256 RepID=UPI0025BBAA52
TPLRIDIPATVLEICETGVFFVSSAGICSGTGFTFGRFRFILIITSKNGPAAAGPIFQGALSL